MTKCCCKSFLLKVLFFLSFLCVFNHALLAQESVNISESSKTENQSLNTEQADLNQSSVQNQSWNWSDPTYDQNQNSPSTIALFFKMVFALALVVVIVYFLLKLLRRGSKLFNSDDPFLRHVSHLPISASKSVDVVTILDHAYILGVSDNSVNLVGEITDKELVNSMNLYADKNDNTKRPRSFNDILNIFMPGAMSQKKSENIYGSSAWNASEMLRQQRERLSEEPEDEER